ncbi:MAG: hypothetical protein AAF299_13900 [Pseudomonadota bacterium]
MAAHNRDKASEPASPRVWRSIRLLVLVAGAVCVFALGLFASQNSWFSRTFHDSFQSRQDAKARADRQALNKLWADRVVKGGYILHIRHAQREKWYDSAAFDAYELAQGIDASTAGFARATCLTPQGVEEAKLIGNVFRLVGTKVSEVISSPSCRARQTAQHAFGDGYKVANSLLNRTAVMPEQNADFAKALRALLMSVEVRPDANVVLTGHGATLFWAGPAVVDEIRMSKRKGRRETGFFVLERKDGRIIAHHRFASIRDFANVLIKLPVN